jgi:hypothetical protein
LPERLQARGNQRLFLLPKECQFKNIKKEKTKGEKEGNNQAIKVSAPLPKG